MDVLLGLLLVWVISILFCGFVIRFSYNRGYADREKIFQRYPVIFVVGKENAFVAYHEEGIVKIRVYNKKLIEFVGESK